MTLVGLNPVRTQYMVGWYPQNFACLVLHFIVMLHLCNVNFASRVKELYWSDVFSFLQIHDGGLMSFTVVHQTGMSINLQENLSSYMGNNHSNELKVLVLHVQMDGEESGDDQSSYSFRSDHGYNWLWRVRNGKLELNPERNRFT